MKFTIKSDLVAHILLNAKPFKKYEELEEFVNFSITPSISKNDEGDIVATLLIQLESNAFTLNFKHCFILEFEQEVDKQDIEQEIMRELLIERCYPYSRGYLNMLFANSGYGGIKFPSI